MLEPSRSHERESQESTSFVSLVDFIHSDLSFLVCLFTGSVALVPT